MPTTTDRQERLFSIASRGIGFEAWKKSEETQFILLDLQREAEVARERCTELSPVTQREELIEAQIQVKVFKTLVDRIHSYIQAGKAAEQELSQPESYDD